MKVQNDILCALDSHKCVVLLLLDMSAAFDIVGIEGQVLKLFRSYLLDRKHFVMVDRIKSAVKDLHFGVLGPMLYLLHTSPLGDIIKRHNLDFHFYADDTQLYLAVKPNAAEQPGSIACIEACVSDIDLWMAQNKLKLNKRKTELLILSAHHRTVPSIEHIWYILRTDSTVFFSKEYWCYF